MMEEPTAWTHTREAVKDFMQLLACNKCEERPTKPVRYIDCQHLFCSDCIQHDIRCFVCDVPVRPTDIRVDHITSTLVSGCDKILNIIFSDGNKENEEEEKEYSEGRISSLGEGMESGFTNLTDILSSTRLSKGSIHQGTPHKEIPATILEESDDSDKTEKMEETVDDTVKLTDSDELDELRNTGKSVKTQKTTIDRNDSQLEKPISQSRSRSIKDSIKVPKNVNKTNRKGETLLHQACVKGQENMVKMLLDNGADPNTKDNANWTPLQEAISLGLYRICEMLLENGASTDTPGIDNKTALHEAVINDKCKEAALLLSYDANPNVYDQHGKKPIDYCTSDEMRKLLSKDNLLNDTRERLIGLNTSFNRSIGSSIHKIVVLACNLKKSTCASLFQLASKHKVKVVNSFISSVTHVIVESDQQLFFNYDLLLSILHGKWILSSEWIQIGLSPECMDLREIDLDIFEMKFLTYDDTPARARLNAEKQNPGLFNNCFFYFALNPMETYIVGQISLTKKSLIRLSNEGGGSTLSREPNPEDIQKEKRIPFHVANNERHPLHNCSHYIIYAPGKEEPRLKYNMPHIKTLPLVWFIECIEKFTLADPALFGII